MSKRILITGGCGFVGSSLAFSLKQKYPFDEIIAFDNLKRRGSELNIQRHKDAGVVFIHGDLRNKEDIEVVGHFDLIIDAAAEPSVMAGLNGSSDYLIGTNLNGTINCLNQALKYSAGFIFLSTSRVYPISDIEQINYTESQTRFELHPEQQQSGVSLKGISERFSLENSRSLYGATKLASELMIKEYNQLFGLKTIVNRCGVITGPWQMGKIDQGVLVLWAARHYWKNNKLSYIGYGGEGKQVRDLLHVEDLFNLIELQILNLDKLNGKTFNVGGGREISVSLKELTHICEEISGNRIEINNVKENRAADIRIYITDNTLVTQNTGWEPRISPHKIVADVFDWIKNNEQSLKGILD